MNLCFYFFCKLFEGCNRGRIKVLVFRHIQHIFEELARLCFVSKLLLVKEGAEVFYISIADFERVRRSDGRVQAMVAHRVVEEKVIDSCT